MLFWHLGLDCFKGRRRSWKYHQLSWKGPCFLWFDCCGHTCGLVAKPWPTLVTPGTIALQAPLSMGFPRQEYWSGLPFPSPGDLPDLGTELGSPALQADSLPTELQGKPPVGRLSVQILGFDSFRCLPQLSVLWNNLFIFVLNILSYTW